LDTDDWEIVWLKFYCKRPTYSSRHVDTHAANWGIKTTKQTDRQTDRQTDKQTYVEPTRQQFTNHTINVVTKKKATHRAI